MALTLLLPSCDKASTDNATPLVHNAGIDIWPDSIDFHTGIIIRAYGDSMLQVRVEGNVLRTVNVPPARKTAFRFNSGMPVFDALYRMETADTIPDSWWRFSPYEIYLNPLNPREGTAILGSRLKNGYIIPPATRRYTWPVINDNGLWLLAACELFKTGADRRWLETIGETAEKVITEDCRAARNNSTGLFFGIPRYLAGTESIFPRWMTPSDIFATQTLAVNIGYWSALSSMDAITAEMALKNERSRFPELPVYADSLLHAINREFWMPNRGCYSAAVYGSPFTPLQLQVADNLAQSLAVVTGMPSSGMVNALMRNTPLSPLGIPLFTPAVNPDAAFADITPATIAFRAIAAAQHGDETAFDDAMGALLHNAAISVLGNSEKAPRTLRGSITGLILRGFLGMKFAFDGIHISPSVPRSMPGTKKLTGLLYRRALLDITIEGTGKEISSFTIDGTESTPFIPAALEGSHHIGITLSNSQPTQDNAAHTCDDGAIPPPPAIEWTSSREAFILPEDPARQGSTSHKKIHPADKSLPDSYSEFVYLNGVLTDELMSQNYRLYDSPSPVTVQFVSVENNRLVSFSAKPHIYIPEQCRGMVYLASVARSGTRIIEDKKIATRFVESDRQRNRDLTFDYDAPHEGEYIIEVHYISGLGIVNSRRRTAMRSLYVDGNRQGVFVFPQHTPGSMDAESAGAWQNLTAFSNPLKIKLRKGRNRLSLRLYQPTPVYIDPTANAIVADFIRITAIDAAK